MDIPLKFIKLEDSAFHPVIKSRQGEKELYWIIDTGASKTVFDKNLTDYYSLIDANPEEFQSIGIGNGVIETSLGEIKKLRIGKIKLSKLKVALIDLNHINNIFRKYTDITIAGLLGSDILYIYGCQINYHTRTISFRRRPKNENK